MEKEKDEAMRKELVSKGAVLDMLEEMECGERLLYLSLTTPEAFGALGAIFRTAGKVEAMRAEPAARWIPVTERLPKKEGWYITTVESEKTGKRRIENDLFAVDIALAHGHTPNKFCKDGYRQRTVAWMPFPEPYEEDQDEQGAG